MKLNNCLKINPGIGPSIRIVLSFLLFLGIGGVGIFEVSASFAKGDYEKLQWISKVASTLRSGQGLDPGESVESLLALDRSRIIEYFMADPRFQDTVLHFHLYFLGFRQDALRTKDGSYLESLFDYPLAIRAAQAVTYRGGYQKAFEFEQDRYLMPLIPPTPEEPGDNLLPARVLRLKIEERIQLKLENLIRLVDQDPQPPISELCNQFLTDFDDLGHFFGLGISLPILIQFINADEWYGDIYWKCLIEPPTISEFLEAIKAIYKKNKILFERIQIFEPEIYEAKRLQDLRVLDLNEIENIDPGIQFGFVQRATLVNSSTNYNRKRASYILKRFFCDDLTPIPVENPLLLTRVQGRTQTLGQHGSDPSCFACHHRLDPMAGFFKSYGSFFRNFENKPLILFDDRATQNRQEYEAQWLAPSGSLRPWHIGYIRSTLHENLNEYGTMPNDLFRIIQKAPETKRCIAKRMFEFFVGENQVVDEGYLERLTKHFSEGEMRDEAFSEILMELLLSHSYTQSDPKPDECYDFGAGAQPQNAPPCRVSFLLNKNCTQCHGNSHTAGKLNLAQWIDLPDGRKSFVHLDENGNQRSHETTFKALVERLSTPDIKRRMPKDKHMSTSDRQKLYLWANSP